MSFKGIRFIPGYKIENNGSVGCNFENGFPKRVKIIVFVAFMSLEVIHQTMTGIAVGNEIDINRTQIWIVCVYRPTPDKYK